MYPDDVLTAMIDSFFFIHPDRDYFVFADSASSADADTFIVVTRGLDVTAFDRMKQEGSVAARDLADWFSDTDEGQAAIQEFVAGLTAESQLGSDLQARGRLMLMPADPTAH